MRRRCFAIRRVLLFTSLLFPHLGRTGAAGMEVASRAPALVAGLARAAANGGTSCARTAVEMLSKLCLFSSQGYCLALQVGNLDRLCRRVTLFWTLISKLQPVRLPVSLGAAGGLISTALSAACYRLAV